VIDNVHATPLLQRQARFGLNAALLLLMGLTLMREPGRRPRSCGQPAVQVDHDQGERVDVAFLRSTSWKTRRPQQLRRSPRQLYGNSTDFEKYRKKIS